jgi:hypothetical protein
MAVEFPTGDVPLRLGPTMLQQPGGGARQGSYLMFHTDFEPESMQRMQTADLLMPEGQVGGWVGEAAASASAHHSQGPSSCTMMLCPCPPTPCPAPSHSTHDTPPLPFSAPPLPPHTPRIRNSR